MADPAVAPIAVARAPVRKGPDSLVASQPIEVRAADESEGEGEGGQGIAF
jgi:hypothetical protein